MNLSKHQLKILGTYIIFTVFIGCQTDQSTQLVGLWEINFIKTPQSKKLNLPWQGIKFKADGSFVSWNTRQHFEGTWQYQDDTLELKGAHLDWMDSKWNIEVFTHPDHYRKIIKGKLAGYTTKKLAFQLSKVHHLYVDEINAKLISKAGGDILLLGKWWSQDPGGNSAAIWLQFNENNTFLIGKGEENYENFGVWLLNEEQKKIELISFSTEFKDLSWDFKVTKDTLLLKSAHKQQVLLKKH